MQKPPIIKRKQSEEKPILGPVQIEPPKFQIGRIQTLVPEWLQKKWEPGERQTEGFKLPKLSFGDVKTEAPWKKKPTKPKEESYIWLRIVPRDGEKYENGKLLKLLSSADNGTFCWRYYCDDSGKLQIHIGCQPKSIVAVKKAIETVFGQVDVEEMSDEIILDVAAEGYMKRVGPLGRGLKTKADKAIEDLMLNLKDGACSISITFTKASEAERKQMLRSELSDKEPGSRSSTDESIWDVLKPWKEEKRARSSTTKQAASKESVEQKAKRKAIEQELLTSELYFNVTVHIQASGEHAKSIVSSVAGVLDTSLRDGHRLILDDQADGKMMRRGAKGAFSASDVPLWKESELLTVVGLPDMTNRVAKRIPSLQPVQKRLQDDELAEGIAIGRLIHPVQPPILICIPVSTLLQHFGLFGRTGTGKSATALMMVQSLLNAWAEKPTGKATGMTYIDPKQETVLNIINRLLWMETQGYKIDWDRIHYLSFGEGFPFDIANEYPVGINLLDRSTGYDNGAVAEAVQELLHAAYPGDTVFTDKLIKNGIRTLLEDTREHNLIALTYLYENPDFKSSIEIRDPMVRKFWRMTGDLIKSSQLDPMTNRMETLTGNKRTRRIFGQMKSPLKIRQWMDEGHIVLIDALNVSSANTKILLGYLLNQYYLLAKTRTPNGSLPHMLMIDEAHNVQIPIIEKIVAETRAFGLSIGIITQFPEQLRSEIYNAISENVNTVISCGVGLKSAGQISAIMNRQFTPETLQGLPVRESCVYTKISGIGEKSFKVKADPPITYLPSGKVATYETPEMGEAQRWAIQKIIELQKKDSPHKDEVDRQIDKYLNWLESFAPEEEESTTTGRKTKRS